MADHGFSGRTGLFCERSLLASFKQLARDDTTVIVQSGTGTFAWKKRFRSVVGRNAVGVCRLAHQPAAALIKNQGGDWLLLAAESPNRRLFEAMLRRTVLPVPMG